MTRRESVGILCSLAVALVTSGVSCQSVTGFRRHPMPRRHPQRTYNTQPAAVAPAAPAPLPAAPETSGPPLNVAESAGPNTPVRPTPREAMPPPAMDIQPAPQPVPGSVPIPTPEPGFAKLRLLHQQAAERCAALPTYTAQLRRREQINGKDKAEEVMLFKFRQEPWSVYFKWTGPHCQGREVVYVKGRHGGMIHTLLAKGDVPLMPAGKVMSLLPDHRFVVASSRHSITEAGIGTMVEQFGRLLSKQETGDSRHGTLRYAGPVRRPELPQVLEAVEQTISAGSETPLPRGGKRHWFFDPANQLPVLVVTYDHSGHEVEFYCYEGVQGPVALGDDDFNPEKLWKR